MPAAGSSFFEHVVAVYTEGSLAFETRFARASKARAKAAVS